MIHVKSIVGNHEFLIMADEEDDAWELLSKYLERLSGFKRVRDELKIKTGWIFTKNTADFGINYPNCGAVITPSLECLTRTEYVYKRARQSLPRPECRTYP